MKLDTYLTLCAEYYEIDKPNAPTDELDFYRSYVKEANGSILEPMCGTGRFMLPLVSEGYNIEGYDASPQMLNYLHKKADNLNLQLNSWEQFAETALSDKTMN